MAVPDFAVIVRAYNEGEPLRDLQGLLLGGQDYRLNFHAAVFDEPFLRDLMEGAGVSDVRPWRPETVADHEFRDESAITCRIGGRDVPLSLNLEGAKR